jgi:hypothetical protein
MHEPPVFAGISRYAEASTTGAGGSSSWRICPRPWPYQAGNRSQCPDKPVANVSAIARAPTDDG